MITECNDVLTYALTYVIIIMYTNEVRLMQTDRKQLAMNLSYLIKNENVIPGPLLNEIILEYVNLINNNVGAIPTNLIDTLCITIASPI